MKRILVTGADGLIGAELARHFESLGHDSIRTTRRPERQGPKTILIDLSAPQSDLSGQAGPIDAVLHTAAIIPRQQTPNTEENAERTRIIDINIARFCRNHDIPVLYCSSAPLYNLKDPSEKTEDSPILPVSPYHAAKADGENLFLQLDKAIIARISSPYGLHSAAETVLKIFLTRATNNETITVWGNGKREQDFIHVRDIAHFANLALFSGKAGLFNVTSGKAVTMAELAQLATEICGSGTVDINHQFEPAGESYARFSIHKAKNILNWSPEITLENGLRDIQENWKNESSK